MEVSDLFILSLHGSEIAFENLNLRSIFPKDIADIRQRIVSRTERFYL